MTICCRYDIKQGNIRSDVKQTVSKDHNITDSKSESHVKPSELEYEVTETDAEAEMKLIVLSIWILTLHISVMLR